MKIGALSCIVQCLCDGDRSDIEEGKETQGLRGGGIFS